MRQIFTFDEVDSTNAVAKRYALEGRGECAVAAARQTAGRGRLARSWESPRGEGQWLSLKHISEPTRRSYNKYAVFCFIT